MIHTVESKYAKYMSSIAAHFCDVGKKKLHSCLPAAITMKLLPGNQLKLSRVELVSTRMGDLLGKVALGSSVSETSRGCSACGLCGT